MFMILSKRQLRGCGGGWVTCKGHIGVSFVSALHGMTIMQYIPIETAIFQAAPELVVPRRLDAGLCPSDALSRPFLRRQQHLQGEATRFACQLQKHGAQNTKLETTVLLAQSMPGGCLLHGSYQG